jgi:hypothetical protein
MLVHSCNLIQFEACFLPVFDITKSVSEQKMKLKVFVANQSFLSTFDNIFHMMSTMHYYLFFHISYYFILLITHFSNGNVFESKGRTQNTTFVTRVTTFVWTLPSSPRSDRFRRPPATTTTRLKSGPWPWDRCRSRTFKFKLKVAKEQ